MNTSSEHKGGRNLHPSLGRQAQWRTSRPGHHVEQQYRFGPISNRFGPTSDRFGPISDRFGPISDRFGPISDRFGPISDQNLNCLVGQAAPAWQAWPATAYSPRGMQPPDAQSKRQVVCNGQETDAPCQAEAVRGALIVRGKSTPQVARECK
jgi:hypothetical protein